MRLHVGRNSQGFALAGVLWLLAGIAVVIAGVSDAVKSAAQANQALKQRVALVQAEQEAGAELAFLLGTYRMFGTGVSVGDQLLRLDGATYPLSRDPKLSANLQDLAGLVALNESASEALTALLSQCRVEQTDAQRLVDAVADYADADDLRRLQGAEKFDYAALSLPGPSNRRLNAVPELTQVLGWKSVATRAELAPCLDAVQTGESEQLNLWTAPVEVLTALGMSPSLAQSAVAERRITPGQFLSPTLLAFAGQPQNRAGGFNRFADRSAGMVRVRIQHADSPIAREFVWSRSSAGQLHPFGFTHQRWFAPGTAPAEDTKEQVRAPTLTELIAVGLQSATVQNANPQASLPR